MRRRRRGDGEESKGRRLMRGAARGIAYTGAVLGGGAMAMRSDRVVSAVRGAAELGGSLAAPAVTSASRLVSRNSELTRQASNARIFARGVIDSLGDNTSPLQLARSSILNPRGAQQQRQDLFQQSIRSALSARQNQEAGSVGNLSQASQRLRERFQPLAGTTPASPVRDRFELMATQSYRDNAILNNIRQNTRFEKNDRNLLADAVADYNLRNKDSLFNNPEQEVEKFLRTFSPSDGSAQGRYTRNIVPQNREKREQFVQELKNSIQPFSDLGATAGNEKFRPDIMKDAQRIREEAAFNVVEEALTHVSAVERITVHDGFRGLSFADAKNLTPEQKRAFGLMHVTADAQGRTIETDFTSKMDEIVNLAMRNDKMKGLLNKHDIVDATTLSQHLRVDPNILVNPFTNEVLDNRHINKGITSALTSFQQSVKIPVLNINPLDLIPAWQQSQTSAARESMRVMRAGQTHAYLRNIKLDEVAEMSPLSGQNNDIVARTPLTQSNLLYMDGNVYRRTAPGQLEQIDQGLFLASSEFGQYARGHANHVGVTGRDGANDRNFVQRLFDVGGQEEDSYFTQYKNWATKFFDEDWGPNMLPALRGDLMGGGDRTQITTRAEEVYRTYRTAMNRESRPLTRESAGILAEQINPLMSDIQVFGEAFDFSKLSNDDYLVEAANVMSSVFRQGDARHIIQPNRYARTTTGTAINAPQLVERPDPVTTQLREWIDRLVDSPDSFASYQQVLPNKKPDMPLETLSVFFDSQVETASGMDMLRRSFQQYGMRRLDYESGDFVADLVAQGQRRRTSLNILENAAANNQIGRSELDNARSLQVYGDLLSYGDIVRSSSGSEAEVFNFIEDVFADVSTNQLTPFGGELFDGINRAMPTWAVKPQQVEVPMNNANFVIMREGNITNSAKEAVAHINQMIKGSSLPPGQYVDPFYSVGNNLGAPELLNQASAASFDTRNAVEAGKDIVTELFAGRHMRGRDTLENYTATSGIVYGLAERVNNALGNVGLSLSRENLGSAQGIIGNQWLRRIALPYMAYQQAVYFDGLFDDAFSDTAAEAYVTGHETLNHIKEAIDVNRIMRPVASMMSSVGGDQLSEFPLFKPIDFLTMGAFTDFRSGEDVREFYESGEVAIRRNRFWGLGSPSPWSGTGVDYYLPNWYRRMKSDYRFTETMFGSEEDYWANHWMPTLTNPLAPIRHFITDPYFYENMHAESRPYAVTGGFNSLQNIPVAGPLIDGTVGRVLKPRREHSELRRSHREYQQAMNEHIRSQYSMADQGSLVQVSSTGNIQTFAPGTVLGDGPQTVGYDLGMGSLGSQWGSVHIGESAYGGFGGSIGGYGGAAGVAVSGLSEGTGAGTARGQLADINRVIAAQNQIQTASIDSMATASSLESMVNDSFYSASEIAGIYGFLTKSAMGYDESWRGTTLAPSTLMSSYQRQFWDMNLGGAGGALSEIGRRYLPRDMNTDYYSPIRNQMPNFLPGMEGNIDFLHGDPYARIARGEMRLPGEAFERLHGLNPDGTGIRYGERWANYGALDRFRILADVAPHSDQFRVAQKEVTALRANGGMTEDMERQYREILDQRDSRRDSIRTYDRQFGNADIDMHTVTVTGVLDNNTFMVREFDGPIRFAGVDVDDQGAAWLSQFLEKGTRLRIGVASDPGTRVNDDTRGSISAVVYAPGNEQGRMWNDTIRGQALNTIVANRGMGTIDNDGSAPAVRALYSDTMITVGTMMEGLMHDVLPNLPIVGMFADTFAQVRTPLESYRRDEVYGSSFRPWTEPVSSWLVPMFNTAASRSPLVAGGSLAGIGWLAGKGKMKGLMATGGFLVGALGASVRVIGETAMEIMPGNESKWIPERERTEREINQYFDRLRYVKYRGLYEQAARMAQRHEGFDVHAFFDESREKGRRNRNISRSLTERRRWLSDSRKTGHVDNGSVEAELNDLRTGLRGIEEQSEVYQVGKYTTLAIQFRREFESTFYGMDPRTVDTQTALSAFSGTDREYFQKFLETNSARERNEILKYVPEDMRRLLQGKWGLKVDAQESIDDFFSNRHLPDASWDGWRAGVSLDNIKIKTMKRNNVNPTEAGFWQKEQALAEESGAKALPIHSIRNSLDPARLREVLNGAGLSGCNVSISTTYGPGPGGINIDMDILKDIRYEIEDRLNLNMHNDRWI